MHFWQYIQQISKITSVFSIHTVFSQEMQFFYFWKVTGPVSVVYKIWAAIPSPYLEVLSCVVKELEST